MSVCKWWWSCLTEEEDVKGELKEEQRVKIVKRVVDAVTVVTR